MNKAFVIAIFVSHVLTACNYIDPENESTRTIAVSVVCNDEHKPQGWHFDLFDENGYFDTSYITEDQRIEIYNKYATLLIYNDTKTTKVYYTGNDINVIATTDRLNDHAFIGRHPIVYMPDKLYSTLLETQGNDEQTAEVKPRVFTYNIDISLNDKDNNIKDCTEASIEGVARAVDIISETRSDSTAAMYFRVEYNNNKHITGHFTTFGLPSGKQQSATIRLRLLRKDNTAAYLIIDPTDDMLKHQKGTTISRSADAQSAQPVNPTDNNNVDIEPSHTEFIHVKI